MCTVNNRPTTGWIHSQNWSSSSTDIFFYLEKKLYLLSTTWTSLWVYRLFVKTTKFKCAAILEKDSWLSHYYGSHWYSSQDPPYSGPDGFFSLYLTNLIPPKLIQPIQRGQPVTCSSFDELGIRLRITLCTFKVLESPVIPQCFITASFTGFVLHRVHWVVTIRWVLYCCALKGWINASHPSAVSLCSHFSYLSFSCLLFR